MFELKISDKNYKVQFGYNQFIDTDLMDRVKSIVRIMIASDDEKDVNVDDIQKVTEDQMEDALKNFDLLKEVFSTTRELVFVGFQKHNPLPDVYAAGDLMDEYEGQVQELFMQFVNELFAGGFMGDLIQAGQKKTPKRTTKK